MAVFIIGILTGTGAFLLKRFVAWVSHLATAGLNASGYNIALLLIPVAGIVLTGLVCRFVFRRKLDHGVERMMQSLKAHNPELPPQLTFSPIIASTITLGLGGSAGSEGPIAYTGGAIGSNVARLMHMPLHITTMMVGCGAAAGIAGIFKAPVGGTLFALEVLGLAFSTWSVILLFIATLTSALTAYALSGFTLDITYSQPVAMTPDLFWWAIPLGLFCGFYAFYYSRIMTAVGNRLKKIRIPIIKNLFAGVMIGVLLFGFPSLYGEGYGVINQVIEGNYDALTADGPFASVPHGTWVFIAVAVATLLLKCFATSATNNGGGVSGDFAPTLFAGCMAGLVFAMLINALSPWHIPAPLMALFAMAGVMAGAVKAPLMAIFLTIEIVGSFGLLLPVAICATISYSTVKILSPGHVRRRY